MKVREVCLIILLCDRFSAAAVPAAASLSTAFTYQGQLKDDGVPADGIYDLRFTLFDALSAGAAVGSPVTINDWPVVNGLFTVDLDFGANPFDGNARWMQLEVRPGGSAVAYTALAPRQALTAVPYALYALDGPGQAGFWAANGASIYKTNSGNVGIGATDPQANLEVRSSGTPRLRVAKIHTGGFGVFAPAILELKSNFTGTDQPYGKVNFLDGNDVVQGSIEYGADVGLLAPVSLRLKTAGQTRLAITDAGDVGIGTSAPANALSVAGTANVDGSLGIGLSAPQFKLHVVGGSDTSLGGGGYVVTGNTGGNNISIDNNEIMVRNNGAPTTLFLTHEGGHVAIGGNSPNTTRLGLGTSFPSERLDLGGGNIAMGYEIVTALYNGSSYRQAICPPGKWVISGGCDCGMGDTLTMSRPEYGPTMGTDVYWWECYCEDGVAVATAICANIR